MLEKKSIKLDTIEVKADQEKRTIQVYSSEFYTTDSYREIVRPGAYLESLEQKKEQDSWRIPMLWQHSASDVIGYPKVLQEDSKGLFSEDIIPDTGPGCLGTKALILAGTPALWGASVGYATLKSLWDEENEILELLKLDLWERSLVTFPANTGARIQGVKRHGVELLTPELALKVDDVIRRVELCRFEDAIGMLQELLADTTETEEKGSEEPTDTESSEPAGSDAVEALSESIGSWLSRFDR